jgi:hypothetical protein
MHKMAEYEYLAVRCKAQGCGKLIMLHCAGIHQRFIAVLLRKPTTDIEVRCPTCQQVLSYQPQDVFGVLGPEPDADFVSHPAFQSNANS